MDIDGVPVVVDPLCPPNKAFLINRNFLVLAQRCVRRRFWYKPWTWRRENGPITLKEMWGK